MSQSRTSKAASKYNKQLDIFAILSILALFTKLSLLWDDEKKMAKNVSMRFCVAKVGFASI